MKSTSAPAIEDKVLLSRKSFLYSMAGSDNILTTKPNRIGNITLGSPSLDKMSCKGTFPNIHH